MFETAVVRTAVRAADKRYGLLTVSLAAHVAVIVAIVAASISTVTFPDRAPDEYMIPVVDPAPPPIPPPLGVQHPRPAAAQVQQAVPAHPTQITAPSTMPDHASPLPPSSSTSTGETTSSDAIGDESGPIGVPWGVKDSIGTDTAATTTEVPPDAAPMRVGEGVSAPVVLRRVQPEYPRAALVAHMNGSVTVEATIDKSGHVIEAFVVKSTSGIFEKSALDAVRQWLFAPGTYRGRTVDTIFQLNVTFQVR
jgi:TonB family protein